MIRAVLAGIAGSFASEPETWPVLTLRRNEPLRCVRNFVSDFGRAPSPRAKRFSVPGGKALLGWLGYRHERSTLSSPAARACKEKVATGVSVTNGLTSSGSSFVVDWSSF